MAQLCSPGRCWQVTVSWQTAQLISPRRKQHRCYHTMASQEAQTIATTVQLQFTLNHSARQACRHCGTALSTSSPEALKRHLAGCKSLPDSVRDVMDHAAVCDSRAGLGCYGGAHASVYRGFRVTGWGVNECRRCGKVIRGWGRQLKTHSEGGCSEWATADVCGQFEEMDGRGGGDGGKCRHGGKCCSTKQREASRGQPA